MWHPKNFHLQSKQGLTRREGLSSSANFLAGKEAPKYTPTRPWTMIPRPSNLFSHWPLPSHTDRWAPSNGTHQPKPMPRNAPDRSTALHTTKTQTHTSTRRRGKNTEKSNAKEGDEGGEEREREAGKEIARGLYRRWMPEQRCRRRPRQGVAAAAARRRSRSLAPWRPASSSPSAVSAATSSRVATPSVSAPAPPSTSPPSSSTSPPRSVGAHPFPTRRGRRGRPDSSRVASLRPSFLFLGPRVGGERSAGQQEKPDHPAARTAGDPQRRGAREAAGRRHHRAWRGSAQHQPCVAPKEDRCRRRQGGQREEVTQEGRHQVAQEGGCRIGSRQCRCPCLLLSSSVRSELKRS